MHHIRSRPGESSGRSTPDSERTEGSDSCKSSLIGVGVKRSGRIERLHDTRRYHTAGAIEDIKVLWKIRSQF